MTRFKKLGLLIGFAAFAIGLVGAGSASAATFEGGPEYGFCQKNTVTLHEYSDNVCQKIVAAGTGKFEWKPGPNGTKGNFKATTGAAKLNLPSAGTTVECVKSKSSGKVTSTTATKIPKVEFEGCKSEGEECHSTLQPAEKINTKELITALGMINDVAEADIVGEDFKGTVANGGYLAEFQCGAAAVKVKVKGSLVCEIKPVDKKPTSTNGKLTCAESGGKQVPEKFSGEHGEGSAKDTLITELSVVPGAEFDSTQENIAHVIGKLEIRA